MFKKILVPTDGTEFCQRAIDRAAELAKLSGAGLVGLTVTRPFQSGALKAMIPEEMAAKVHEQMAKYAAEKLAIVEHAGKANGVKVEGAIASHEHPWEAIVKVAKERNCDLIVMASHGRRGLSAVLLGSETLKVLTHSEIPVLIVR